MASSSSCLPTAAAAAAAHISHSTPASVARPRLSFPLPSKPKKKLFLSTEGSRGSGRRSTAPAKSQLNEVAGDSSNDVALTEAKPEAQEAEEKNVELSEEAISEFMIQVASLVKLVDSRDIVELQLKNFGCELTIRKKEALPQPQSQAPVVMMPPSTLHAGAPSPYPPQPAAAAPPPTPASLAPPPPASPPKPAKSSHPPLKSPMAGTFYRSPGPGLPSFVKPGDKVNKGQVLCIIEAMKLMNEIEADQSGTVVEILAEDGKPVGVEQPLFVIAP